MKKLLLGVLCLNCFLINLAFTMESIEVKCKLSLLIDKEMDIWKVYRGFSFNYSEIEGAKTFSFDIYEYKNIIIHHTRAMF